MKRVIEIEWQIHDTRPDHPGFRTGKSTLICDTKSVEEAISNAISFAESLPDWEFTKNNIDLEEYREYLICRYYHETKLSKIISIKKFQPKPL